MDDRLHDLRRTAVSRLRPPHGVYAAEDVPSIRAFARTASPYQYRERLTLKRSSLLFDPQHLVGGYILYGLQGARWPLDLERRNPVLRT